MTPPAASFAPVLPGLSVVYQDEHLIAIDKPSGLLSVPGRGADKADCAAARVLAQWPAARVVHRLDMGTSGLLLFALGLPAQQALSRAFETRQVHKAYVAELAGHLAPDEGEVNQPLICDWPNRPRQIVDTERGKTALTRWQVLARGHGSGGHTTRVLLTPFTGRSHQLRVHMQWLGHPILGDELYAPPEAVQAAERLRLHAWRLNLPHPATGEPLSLEAATPF